MSRLFYLAAKARSNLSPNSHGFNTRYCEDVDAWNLYPPLDQPCPEVFPCTDAENQMWDGQIRSLSAIGRDYQRRLKKVDPKQTAGKLVICESKLFKQNSYSIFAILC